MSVHTPFQVDMAILIPPTRNQVNAAGGTGNRNQLSQIMRALGKGNRAPMTHDVANASLIPNFLKTPNKATFCLQRVIMGISQVPSTPMLPLLDPYAHSSDTHAPGTHITGLSGVSRETHRRKPMAVERRTVTLDVLHQRVWWLIGTVNSATQVRHAAFQRSN